MASLTYQVITRNVHDDYAASDRPNIEDEGHSVELWPVGAPFRLVEITSLPSGQPAFLRFGKFTDAIPVVEGKTWVANGATTGIYYSVPKVPIPDVSAIIVVTVYQ